MIHFFRLPLWFQVWLSRNAARFRFGSSHAVQDVTNLTAKKCKATEVLSKHHAEIEQVRCLHASNMNLLKVFEYVLEDVGPPKPVSGFRSLGLIPQRNSKSFAQLTRVSPVPEALRRSSTSVTQMLG